MTGHEIWASIRDQQQHRAALYLTYASISADGDAYMKLMQRAWEESGLRFKMSLGAFRAAMEKLWREDDGYCTQNHGDCSTCALVNYGRDCHNRPVIR